MKFLAVGLLALTTLTATAQTASQIESAAPAQRPGETQEQHGARLLAEMVKALGGDAWLNKHTMYREGQTARFFRGAPTGIVTRFDEDTRFATATSPDLTRIEFLTVKGMIMPGMKKDVVHLWDTDQGYEFTYKGRTILPADQVADYMRRRQHSLEEVMRTWVKAPGVVILYEGSGMRDRRPVDKVSILAANNDAVTIELEQDTHLPLQRSFQWRNTQFKDFDIDEEVYGDWRIFNDIQTPMNMTRYRNGDMVDQSFYTKTVFNQPLADDLFNKELQLKKK